jgi:hypothetical protein
MIEGIHVSRNNNVTSFEHLYHRVYVFYGVRQNNHRIVWNVVRHKGFTAFVYANDVTTSREKKNSVLISHLLVTDYVLQADFLEEIGLPKAMRASPPLPALGTHTTSSCF